MSEFQRDGSLEVCPCGRYLKKCNPSQCKLTHEEYEAAMNRINEDSADEEH